MSTHCSIAVMHQNGTVSAVYCHSNGYVGGGMGELLLEEYPELAKVEALVALGDLSFVAEDPPACGAYATRSKWDSENADEPWERVKPRTYASVGEYFLQVGKDIDDDAYRYLFMDRRWVFWDDEDVPPEGKPTRDLADVLKEEGEEVEAPSDEGPSDVADLRAKVARLRSAATKVDRWLKDMGFIAPEIHHVHHQRMRDELAAALAETVLP